jgi:hypothetical protein
MAEDEAKELVLTMAQGILNRTPFGSMTLDEAADYARAALAAAREAGYEIRLKDTGYYCPWS